MVLEEVLPGTKLGEELHHDDRKELSEESCDTDALIEVLRTHCDYMQNHHCPETGRITADQAAWAWRNRLAIANDVRFPHNLSPFVEAYLPHVLNDGLLWEALQEARAVEVAVRNWFRALEPCSQLYACLVALFPDLDGAVFRALVQSAARSLGIAPVDISACLRDVRPFVAGSKPSSFRHPSYRDGVVLGSPRRGIRKTSPVKDTGRC